MVPQGKTDSGGFAGPALGRMRDFPATILICWLVAAILVALSLALSGANGKTVTAANSSRHADASPIDRRPACLDARVAAAGHQGWRV